jgi:hypothetical protein
MSVYDVNGVRVQNLLTGNVKVFNNECCHIVALVGALSRRMRLQSRKQKGHVLSNGHRMVQLSVPSTNKPFEQEVRE